MGNRCLAYLAMMIIAVAGILVVIRMESDTHMITGQFAGTGSIWLTLPLTIVAMLIFIALLLFTVYLCDKKTCNRKN